MTLFVISLGVLSRDPASVAAIKATLDWTAPFIDRVEVSSPEGMDSGDYMQALRLTRAGIGIDIESF